MNQQIQINRATEINQLHSEVCEVLRMTVPKAIRIGELLVEQKAEIAREHGGSSHGYWIPWIEANLIFSERTAQGYIRGYRKWSKSATVADFPQTIRELFYGIAKPTPEEISDATTEIDEKARAILREKKRLEEEQHRLKAEREAAIIEIPIENIVFEEIDTNTPASEKAEQILHDEEMELKALVGEKMLEEIPEDRLHEAAGHLWEKTCRHFSKSDRFRIAKAVVEMLYRKYPQLKTNN